MTLLQRLSTVIASLILVGLGPTGAAHAQARELSFDDRVAAQKAIEQVYWNHRIWPKENPGPKPALSAVMPDEAIRARVEDYLEKSNALETWWHRPVTAEQLQAEMDRMATNTRDGETLRELHRALGNDPFVIAETLARQTLVERLIRNWYASDTRFIGALKSKAEAELSGCADVDCMKAMGGEYHEMTWVRRDTDAAEWTNQLGRLATAFGAPAEALPIARLTRLLETPEAFVVSAVRSQREGEVAIASVVWPKRSFDAWWAVERAGVSPAIEATPGNYVAPFVPWTVCTNASWSPTSFEVPDPRSLHTAVWTGTEMIVWGGDSVNTGGRYNPSTDTWTPTSTGANVPLGRRKHTAVWTGTEMIIWGGSNVWSAFKTNTGGRYNPSTDSWTATSTAANVPAPRLQHAAVWTGTEMIIWGGTPDNGETGFNTGGRYDPASDSWTATSTGANNPAGRRGPTAVWTGTRMVIWGGGVGFASITPYNTGGRYDPSTDSWTATATGANVPAPRIYHSAVWTGTEMIVWGGKDASSSLNTGGRYNPSTDTWSATSTGANVPAARNSHTAVWTGTMMIVWGGSVDQSGGRYDPASDSWSGTSAAPNAPDPRSSHTAVWTGTEMIVWGGLDSNQSPINTGGRYSPSTNSWAPTAVAASVPVARSSHTAVWTGTEMIIWGGYSNSALNTGGRYRPSTDSWTPTSTEVDVPTPRSGHTAVWTGTEMIVWGGYTNSDTNTGGRYTPATNKWVPTSTAASVPAPRRAYTAVWTGTEMIVWGGYALSPYAIFNSGGRYKPASDTWTATSQGSNVPSPRADHTAVWTGSEMIVWGGWSEGSLQYTGGRYVPSSNTWTPTPIPASPAPRYRHTAVWAGSEMIVWGGETNDAVRLNSGARYTPGSGSWSATSLGNAPTTRVNHTAVWTGTEMIVWGGYVNGETNTGGRYTPATDTWIATSMGIDVPAARSYHSAVWTGTEMIVWGGRPVANGSESYGATSSGGRYCACPGGRLSYRDFDGDGYGNSGVPNASCNGSIPAGYVVDDTDCNDANALVHPGATESCNGLDDDCDQIVDNGSATTCSDGNACTQTDTCVLGACVGSNPVTCTAIDQCHVAGTCDASGACTKPLKPDGVACTDSNPCTQTDACHAGACIGGNPVLCAALDQCHDVGVCQPANGQCSNPAKPNGTACEDGNTCSTGDACSSGSCSGTGGEAAPDVESVSASKSGETVTFDWSATAGAISYDVLRGRVRDFPVGSNPTTETCFDDVVVPTANDATVPPSDSGFWYLFRAEYACGNGSYGWAESHGVPTAPRLSGTCP